VPAMLFMLISGEVLSFSAKNVSSVEDMIKDEEKRQLYLINSSWSYLEDNTRNIDEIFRRTERWQTIDLPHTWNAFDAVDAIPGYRRDASWYKKEVFIPDLKNDLRFLLYFEGVNITSEIYVNKKYAGGHVGGYVGFETDITPFIEKGQVNIIHVRVDNSYNPEIIPSQKSDFFIYGGIVRDVWLKVVPSVYIKKIKVRTPKVSRKEAETEVEVTVLNIEKKQQKCTIEVSIKDFKNQIVATKTMARFFPEGSEIVKLKFPLIKNPELWSPDSPVLYTANVKLKRANKLVDNISAKFGYRWFEFKEHGPFYLNGNRLLLRGTHRHEDYGGYGNAIPDSLHRKDIQEIKNMGANSIRLAHYPQDPEIYRTCDELGLLVWDELPWCRGGIGEQKWKNNTKRMLVEMIEQNFNHPCIIIWSLGNEIYWLPDFPDGDNVDSLRSFLNELNELAHELDPSRVTAVRKFYEGADIVDLFSPSIWAGWYSGVYKNYEKALLESKIKYKRFFHAEYGGASHVGRHVENPISGEGHIETNGWEESVNQVRVKNVANYVDWSENYIVDLFDWYLHISEQLDWFTGSAQWAFKDFATPLRPENPIPYVNQKGLVDRAGNPKDAYYVFKSYWTVEPKFCYIESHTWKFRCGPKGLKREVCVYSNCEEVEFFLNGKSQSRRQREATKFPACGLSWNIDFEEGDNYLIAKGFANGEQVATDSVEVYYSYKKFGKPKEIELTSKPLSNGNLLIEARIVDENGQLCLDYNKRIYFSSNGSGHLLINYGTPTRSQVIEAANGYAAIEFAPDRSGKVVIEVRNQDFKGSYYVIR